MLGDENPVQALFARGMIMDCIKLENTTGNLHWIAMAPDNITASERLLAMVDFSLSKSSTYNYQRLNTMLQYKLNNNDN